MRKLSIVHYSFTSNSVHSSIYFLLLDLNKFRINPEQRNISVVTVESVVRSFHPPEALP